MRESMPRQFVETSIARVRASDWDALVGDDDPFVEHAFLLALEESGSVGRGTGWSPCHLLATRGDRLVAAMPLYEKTHSYGEYIFDFAWASAALRAGIHYYPKLVSMVPFTPATGRRMLRAPGLDERSASQLLVPGLERARAQSGASSLHANFLSDEECASLSAHPGFLRRATHQFRFDNPGFESFDALLESFRAPARKQIRRERRLVSESELEVETLTGDALTPVDLQVMFELYVDTCERKGSFPYLTRAFFEIVAERLRHRAVMVVARESGRIVAATLSFEKGSHLYGRYWGARRDYDGLHFELCYYRLLERAIERGMTRVEAGAQGAHKLKRGFLPAVIHSAHSFDHRGLSAGVAAFVEQESAETQRIIEQLALHGPGRRADR
jgi:uncharacterized protein